MSFLFETINDLYFEISKDLYSFVYSKCSDSELSKDILQDVFLRLVVDAKKGKLNSLSKDYLKLRCFVMGKSMLIDRWRKNTKRIEKELNSVELLEDLRYRNSLNQIAATLYVIAMTAPEIGNSDRTILDLYFYRLSVKKIAESFGISPSTVRKRLRVSFELIKSKYLAISH
jgi:RNA polymerase sigma-70 factor, ECF subfamily